MRFRKPIPLEVYLLSDEQIKCEKLGMEPPELDYDGETELRYFCSIDSLWTYNDNDKMSGIYSGGSSFVVKSRIEPLLELCNEHVHK